MIGQLVHSRRRNQCDQPLDKNRRLEPEVGGEIPERDPQQEYLFARSVQ